MNKSQREQVEELLLTKEWVSVVAFLNLHITRGAAIIHILRKDGWNIQSERVEGKTYAQYRLMALPNGGQTTLI